MTMRSTRALCALALASGAALGAGCGSGGGTIPRADAESLQTGLDNVSQAVSAGKCNAAVAAVENVRSKVRNLQGTIPSRLQANLERGVARLAATTPGDCQDVARQLQQTDTTTQTTTETTTPTVTTDTTPTETTPTQTTTTPTETTTTPTGTTTAPTGGASPETTTTTTTPAPGDGSGGAQG